MSRKYCLTTSPRKMGFSQKASCKTQGLLKRTSKKHKGKYIISARRRVSRRRVSKKRKSKSRRRKSHKKHRSHKVKDGMDFDEYDSVTNFDIVNMKPEETVYNSHRVSEYMTIRKSEEKIKDIILKNETIYVNKGPMSDLITHLVSTKYETDDRFFINTLCENFELCLGRLSARKEFLERKNIPKPWYIMASYGFHAILVEITEEVINIYDPLTSTYSLFPYFNSFNLLKLNSNYHNLTTALTRVYEKKINYINLGHQHTGTKNCTELVYFYLFSKLNFPDKDLRELNFSYEKPRV